MVRKSSKGTSSQDPESTPMSLSTKKVRLSKDLFIAKKVRHCRLCRVVCNSKADVDRHRSGNKHKRNLKAYDSQQSIDKVVAAVQDLSLCGSQSVSRVNKQKAWGILPSGCDVDVGNAVITFTGHETGVESNTYLKVKEAKWNAKPKGMQAAPDFIELITKETKCCQLRRVACSSEEVLMKHQKGKKHEAKLKALEKQQTKGTVVDAVQDSKSNVSESNSKVKEKGFKILPYRSLVDACGKAAAGLECHGDRKPDFVTEEAKPSAEENQKPIAADSKVRSGTRNGKQKDRKCFKPKQVFTCNLCNSKCTSRTDFDIHSAGRKHKSNLKKFLMKLQENKLCSELQCLNIQQSCQMNPNSTPSSLPPEDKTASEVESCMDFSKLQNICFEYLGPSPSVLPLQ